MWLLRVLLCIAQQTSVISGHLKRDEVVRFHDFTVSVGGKMLSYREHESLDLVRATVQVFAELLERGGRDFFVPVHGKLAPHVQLGWHEDADGAAWAYFYLYGEPLTLSVLVAGLTADADSRVLLIVQAYLESFWGEETEKDLLAIAVRPAIASIPFTMRRADLELVADMKRCLAAAFFEWVCWGQAG